jgi:hypothetical protein
VIGVDLLNVKNGGTFLVPGTHGIVFPWTPPSYGIPKLILEQLEQKLIEKLTEVTENWIASQSISHSTRQSSPASQSSHGSDDDVEMTVHGTVISMLPRPS